MAAPVAVEASDEREARTELYEALAAEATLANEALAELAPTPADPVMREPAAEVIEWAREEP